MELLFELILYRKVSICEFEVLIVDEALRPVRVLLLPEKRFNSVRRSYALHGTREGTAKQKVLSNLILLELNFNLLIDSPLRGTSPH